MINFLLNLFCMLLFMTLTATASLASEPIKIGVTLGLTGRYAEMSDMQMKGFRLWEEDVNKRGGILGRKVRVIIHDDKSEPETAKSLYEQMIVKDKVDLVFGPYSSAITEAILPITEKYGYPVLTTGASADSLWQKGYKYVFGVYTPASKYAVSFLEFLVKKDYFSLAIVYADDTFSKSIADGIKKWAERFGLEILHFEGFKKGTENLDDIAKRARASGAKALIVCGHLQEAVDMRLSIKRIGWTPGVYYASVGPALKEFHDKLKAETEGVFSSSQWEMSRKIPHSAEFYDSFLKRYREEPSYHAATTYAGGQILEEAIKKAKGLNRERIRETLYMLDAMTIIGRYGVDKTGMQIRHFNFVIQWQKGKKEVVLPEQFRTAVPVIK